MAGFRAPFWLRSLRAEPPPAIRQALANAPDAHQAVASVRTLTMWLRHADGVGAFGLLVVLTITTDDPSLAPAVPWVVLWGILAGSFSGGIWFARRRLRRALTHGDADAVRALWLATVNVTGLGFVLAAGATACVLGPANVMGPTPSSGFALAVTLMVFALPLMVLAAVCLRAVLRHGPGLRELAGLFAARAAGA